jgi:hypothetical protein
MTRKLVILSMFVFVFLLMLFSASESQATRWYSPETGRFLSRDSIGETGGELLYRYCENNPINETDVGGMVTFKQMNEIAKAMGFKPITSPKGKATELIQKIQRKVGFRGPPGANLGPRTVEKVEAWLKKNNKTVKLRDSKSSKDVLDWIVKYWPANVPKNCPILYGEFLALIEAESRDTIVLTGGKPTYFNAIGGPYASRPRTTAVGLGQVTRATAPDFGLSLDDRYDGEKSIKASVEALHKEGAKYGYEPTRNKKIFYRALNRWEAWYGGGQADIKAKGKQINELIKGKGGADKVTKAEIDGILGTQ